MFTRNLSQKLKIKKRKIKSNMSTLTYSVVTNNKLTDKGLFKSPELVIHSKEGDFNILGINSLNLKFNKKGRGKGTSLVVNITVPGIIDGEPAVSNETFNLPEDLALVLKASDFWKNHGINLTRPSKKTEPTSIIAKETVGVVSAP